VQPMHPGGRVCLNCGSPQLKAREHNLTEKKRVKFGLLWVLVSLLSLGLAVLVWLVLPRRNVVVSVDRYVQCERCGTRQL
jgi:hypothetical protein